MLPHDSESNEPTDAALIGQAQRGDADAVEALYTRYRDWVYAAAWRWTNDPHLAQDVVQETFLAFVRRLPHFEPRGRLTTYLYPIVRHAALAAGARAARRPDPARMPGAAMPPGPVDHAVADDALDSIRAALDALSFMQREVLILRYVDGHDLETIAGVLGLPLGTVKTRLHHARRAVEESMPKENPEDE